MTGIVAPEEACRRLLGGGLLVHPSESVYGVGGALEEEPLRHLRAIKERPDGGFVVLVPSVDDVEDMLSPPARSLARSFWPGALTFAVRDPGRRFPASAKALDGTIAIRVPGSEPTLSLLRRAGAPITSSSANLRGKRAAVTPEDALESLAPALPSDARGLCALDGGRLPGGPPSTLLADFGGGGKSLRTLRQGALGPWVEELLEEGAPVRSSYRLVFACAGNTCRSPLAEVLAKRRIAEKRLSWLRTSSAGLYAHSGAPASMGALRIAEEQEMDLSRHRSDAARSCLDDPPDLFVAMTAEQRRALLGLGVPAHRAHRLLDLAGEGGDIADPFGGSLERYRRCLDELGPPVARLVDRIAGLKRVVLG